VNDDWIHLHARCQVIARAQRASSHLPIFNNKRTQNHETSMMRTYMLRNTFFAVLTVLAAAASSQAAIMLQASDPTPLPNGNLVSRTITAVGTSGEMINTFTNPVITAMGGGKGIHNVAQAFTNGGTPSRGDQTPALYNPEWAPYDTYFYFDATNSLSLGPAFEETNDGTTSGMLSLPATPSAPRSGFGGLTSQAASSKLFTTADDSLAFMQVVMAAGEQASLSIRIIGDGGATVGDFTGANAFTIGGGAPALMGSTTTIGPTTMAVFNHTFTATGGTGPYTWGNLMLTAGAPTTTPTLAANGDFGWFTGNSPRPGTYSWNATVTDAAQATATGTLTIELLVPEPATMMLAGLAMVGLVGFARRR
jgi:hypothetical protein